VRKLVLILISLFGKCKFIKPRYNTAIHRFTWHPYLPSEVVWKYPREQSIHDYDF
jgi:hypothetical protein